MNQNQFDAVFSRMGKKYGRIRKGREDDYMYPLLALEGNALKVHRKHRKSNSRRMREAIALVLFDIQGILSGTEVDTASFRNEDNERLERAMLMAFDPQSNDKVKAVIEATYGPEGMPDDQRQVHYGTMVQCLLRIKDSVDFWEKNLGPDGYFDFIEPQIADLISTSDMDFCVVGGDSE